MRFNWRARIVGVPVIDVALAGLPVVLAFGAQDHRGAVELAVSVATAATVGLRTVRPVAMAAGFSAGMLLLATYRLDEIGIWGFVGLLVVCFSVTANLPWRQARWCALLLLVCGVVLDGASHDPVPAEVVGSPLIIVSGPGAAGLLLRRSREQAERLVQLTDDLTQQREQVRQSAVLAERARIAREMHDVIAHSVGVMVVQAGAAEKSLPGGHPSVAAIAEVRHTGRQALDELRRVVGALRSADEESTQPQPGIADLWALAGSPRALRRVDLSVADDLDRLPPGLQLVVYRTVQEGLTNASRYAVGSAVTVHVTAPDGVLRVVVDDDGGQRDPSQRSAGYGLTGLVERAHIYGGTFTAGPHPDRPGWGVVLSIPAGDDSDLTWLAPP